MKKRMNDIKVLDLQTLNNSIVYKCIQAPNLKSVLNIHIHTFLNKETFLCMYKDLVYYCILQIEFQITFLRQKSKLADFTASEQNTSLTFYILCGYCLLKSFNLRSELRLYVTVNV